MGDRSYRSTAGEEMLFFSLPQFPVIHRGVVVPNSPSGRGLISTRAPGVQDGKLRVAATCLRTVDPRLYDVNLSVAYGCPTVAGILDPRDQSHLSILSGSTQEFSPSLQLTLLFHSANRVCRSDSQSQCCLVAEKQSTLFVTPTPAYPSFPWAIGAWAEPIRFG